MTQPSYNDKQVVRLPYADNQFCYYMLGRADTWVLPELRNREEQRQEHASSVPGNRNVPNVERNTEEQPAEPYECDVPVYVPVPERDQLERVSVSCEEQERIIWLAQSGVQRREMCKALGKGKYYYPTVRQVLDEAGL